MKIFKIISISLFLIAICFTAVSFIPTMHKKKYDINKTAVFGQWYLYQYGYPSNFSAAIDPNNYRPLSITENVNLLCNGFQKICAIYAEPDPFNTGKPIIIYGTQIYTRLTEYFTWGVTSPSYIRLKDIED